MFKLTDRFKDVIEYKGHKLYVNLAFDIVLRAYELMEDKHFNNLDKVFIFFDMFIVNRNSESSLFKFEDKNKIVKTIFEQFLGFKKNGEESSGKKSYDLSKDSPYIYASFLQDYNKKSDRFNKFNVYVVTEVTKPGAKLEKIDTDYYKNKIISELKLISN